MAMIKDPIFILGAHKSGTSLLRNLLDGHEELSVIPFESHFLELIGFWIENATRPNDLENLCREDFLERAVEFAKQFNKKDSPYGEVILSRKIDLAKFEKFLLRSEGLEYEDKRIEVYLEAIQVALDLDRDKRLVEKSVENFEYAMYLKMLFPRARFIHILRNPYSNAVALRKFKQKGMKVYPRLDKILETIRSSYYYAEKNQKSIQDYRVIKYEELLDSPKIILKELSQFLEIKFDTSLLLPTSQGEKWLGNSTSGDQKIGISAKGIDAWKKGIKNIEIEAVNRKMGHCLSHFNYPRIETSGSIWLKVGKESLSKYVNNRIYIFQ